jgi:hypothetical protein
MSALVTLEVVPIGDGRWGVRAIGGNDSGEVLADFPTRAEADAEMLSRSMSGDEAASAVGLPKAGYGQSLA